MSAKSFDTEKESIELCLPVNAAYVSAARLTASSIANRIGFEIDEIEDIKAAVSESCTFIIKKNAHNDRCVFKIVFEMREDLMKISLSTGNNIDIGREDEEMSLLMINALMDKVKVENNNSGFNIEMKKIHKKAVFN